MEMSDTVYIADADHYNKVLIRAASVRSSLWIATADIKDLHVRVGQGRRLNISIPSGGEPDARIAGENGSAAIR